MHCVVIITFHKEQIQTAYHQQFYNVTIINQSSRHH